MLDLNTPDGIASICKKLNEVFDDFYLDPGNRPSGPLVDKPRVVQEFSDPEPPEKGEGFEATLAYFEEQILPQTVKTWHPLFLNQMTAGASIPAILGETFSSMINSTMATFEMTPAATVIERNVSMWMAQMLGMPEGSSGIFLPGGSLSNLLALAVARHQRMGTELSQKGLKSIPNQGVILCSDGGHYSVANAASLLGFGTENVVKIASNHRNEILPEAFEKAVFQAKEEGKQPFAAVATMGLTVTGGFDPLEEMAEICRDHDIHLHVDAAFGGGIALTQVGEQLFRGIEHADTVIWDAHKWFHVPLTCTVLLAPDARIFKHVFNTNADYLFHPQDEDIDMADDLGKYTILCGKRLDALPIWLLLKSYGVDYFRQLAESRLKLSHEVYDMLCEDRDLVPSYQPVSPILCFRFLPPGSEEWSPTYTDRLQRWVRETAKKRQVAMFNVAKLKGRDHFRMILINPLTTRAHIIQLLADIRALAQEFMVTHPPVYESSTVQA